MWNNGKHLPYTKAGTDKNSCTNTHSHSSNRGGTGLKIVFWGDTKFIGKYVRIIHYVDWNSTSIIFEATKEWNSSHWPNSTFRVNSSRRDGYRFNVPPTCMSIFIKHQYIRYNQKGINEAGDFTSPEAAKVTTIFIPLPNSINVNLSNVIMSTIQYDCFRSDSHTIIGYLIFCLNSFFVNTFLRWKRGYVRDYGESKYYLRRELLFTKFNSECNC